MPSRHAANPFSTRFVRPGALPYRFRDDVDARSLIEKLERAGWAGQIVGEHGTGKSTLLATLLPSIQAAGRHPMHFVLHQGERSLGLAAGELRHLTPTHVVVVDGFEQLSRWNAFQLRRQCRRRGAGLLVTAHHPVRLPILYETAPQLSTVMEIARRLQADAQRLVSDVDVRTCFERHHGNVRETLFGLYDIYEQRRRAISA